MSIDMSSAEYGRIGQKMWSNVERSACVILALTLPASCPVWSLWIIQTHLPLIRGGSKNMTSPWRPPTLLVKFFLMVQLLFNWRVFFVLDYWKLELWPVRPLPCYGGCYVFILFFYCLKSLLWRIMNNHYWTSWSSSYSRAKLVNCWMSDHVLLERKGSSTWISTLWALIRFFSSVNA